jgi:MFS transporter, ACS family, D-galactonate transporter
MASALLTPLTTSKSEVVHKPRSVAMATVLALLAFSVFINYIDRGNLSIAAPMLKDELGLSGAQLGMLLSSFFWTYGLFQILSGWLVDRFRVGLVMAVGFFLWSAATSVTGLVHGFTALLLVRVVLGIGESVAYPSYSKILAKYIPDTERGFANSLIAAGLACGPAFGMLLGGTLMSRFGWRPFFIVMGLVSLLWLAPWLRWMPRGPGLTRPTLTGHEPGTIDIRRQRSAWGSFVGLFCNAYLLYLLIAWLPFYLVRERHFSMDSMAKIGGAMFLLQALCAATCGRLADRWIAAGRTPTTVHKTFMIAGMLGAGTFLVASSLAGPVLSVVFLMLVGVSLGISTSNIWPMTQRLAGPRTSGRWTGMQCAFGNLSGALTSAVTGLVLDRTGHFFWAFAIAAGFSGIGVLSWAFVVGRIEPVQWRQHTSVRVTNLAADPG